MFDQSLMILPQSFNTFCPNFNLFPTKNWITHLLSLTHFDQILHIFHKV